VAKKISCQGTRPDHRRKGVLLETFARIFEYCHNEVFFSSLDEFLMNLTSLGKLAAENGSFSCVQKRSDIAYPKQYSHRKTEPESFGSNQTHAKILDVI